jgi:hypothetical protein
MVSCRGISWLSEKGKIEQIAMLPLVPPFFVGTRGISTFLCKDKHRFEHRTLLGCLNSLVNLFKFILLDELIERETALNIEFD